jgi:hypothetical protein
LDFQHSGIYLFFSKFFAEALKWMLLAKVQFLVFIIPLLWSVAKEFLASLHLSELLASAWSSLDPSVTSFAAYLRIPEAISMMLSAHVTRFLMRMIGL